MTNPGKNRGRDHGLRAERGQALVEFALVAVALVAVAFLALVFGILDGARLFHSWVTVQHASREGARYAVTGRVNCDGITEDRAACIEQVGLNATTGLSRGGPYGGNVTVTYKKWDFPEYPGPPVSGDPGGQCDAIKVSVTYVHHFVFPLFQALVPSGLEISGRQRMLNEPFGPCS